MSPFIGVIPCFKTQGKRVLILPALGGCKVELINRTLFWLIAKKKKKEPMMPLTNS